jgi:septal ring factor EnvC (AmiA/AmiB activator)
MRGKDNMPYTPPSLIERILGRFVETLVIYALLAGVGFIASASLLTGHFPPTKEEVIAQINKIRDVTNRSQQIIEGIKTTNEKIAEVGPQFEVLGGKIQELEQRIQVLEQESKALKALRR